VFVDLATIAIDDNEISFNGTGLRLDGRSIIGVKYDKEEREVPPPLTCAVTITVPEEPPAPGSFVGDLTIGSGGIT
jgi:hypothetical protein